MRSVPAPFGRYSSQIMWADAIIEAQYACGAEKEETYEDTSYLRSPPGHQPDGQKPAGASAMDDRGAGAGR